MAARKIKLLLDTNVLISAVGFKGKPWQILDAILRDHYNYIGVTSPHLLAEFSEIFHKKFPLKHQEYEYIEEQIETDFEIVKPAVTLDVVRDTDDNRVLEAAVTGKCDFIVTGDRDLLNIKVYEGIKIVTPTDFLTGDQ